jgi:hypothetical protein
VCGDPDCTIPFGFCHCGCEEITLVASKTQSNVNKVKGMPQKYIKGHSRKPKRKYLNPDGRCICGDTNCLIPYGYCHCGCGGKAGIAKRTDGYYGNFEGEPIKYIVGHHISKVVPRQLARRTEEEDRLYSVMISEIKESTVDIFWSFVDKSPGRGPKGDCWIWTGCTNPQGYGILSAKPFHISAHRLSVLIKQKVLHRGLVVMHACDNPPCCNPDHLSEGTYWDNVRDCINKKRFKVNAPKGEKSGAAKLCNEDVLAIRAEFEGLDYYIGKIPPIAKRYGVSNSSIGKIINRDTWKHI